MTKEEFERTLRSHVRRQPFIPFSVQLVDGRHYEIEHPVITFDGSVAGYLSESQGLVDFSFDEVDHFQILQPETQQP